MGWKKRAKRRLKKLSVVNCNNGGGAGRIEEDKEDNIGFCFVTFSFVFSLAVSVSNV